MCQLTRGFKQECNDAVSGIRALYVSNYELIGTPAISASGDITAFTGATGTPFKKYELKDQNADWMSTPQVNQQSGTTMYENVVNFTLTKLTQAKVKELDLMAKSAYGLCVIAEGMDGSYWCIGYGNGTKFTGGAAQISRNFGDLNGANVTLTAMETKPAAQILSYAVFSALVAANP